MRAWSGGIPAGTRFGKNTRFCHKKSGSLAGIKIRIWWTRSCSLFRCWPVNREGLGLRYPRLLRDEIGWRALCSIESTGNWWWLKQISQWSVDESWDLVTVDFYKMGKWFLFSLLAGISSHTDIIFLTYLFATFSPRLIILLLFFSANCYLTIFDLSSHFSYE